jgi:hypothetical protein
MSRWIDLCPMIEEWSEGSDCSFPLFFTSTICLYHVYYSVIISSLSLAPLHAKHLTHHPNAYHLHIGVATPVCGFLTLWNTFGAMKRKCALSLVCGTCCESGYTELLCPSPSYCVNCSGANAFDDRNVPIYHNEIIQDLRFQEGLNFLADVKKFLNPDLRLGQSHTSVPLVRSSYHHRQKAFLPRLNSPSTDPTPATVSCQSEVSTPINNAPQRSPAWCKNTFVSH